MIFTASRGKAFKEEFTFKSAAGKLLPAPNGDYRLTLERGSFIREYTNLSKGRNSVTWILAADETSELEYETLYFVLTYNGSEIARGVLRVQ